MSRFNVRFGEFEENILNEYLKDRKDLKKTPTVNALIKKGLDNYYDDSTNKIIRMAIREQMEFSIKPFTESLASLASKVAYSTGRITFLLVQLALDAISKNKEEKVQMKKLFDETTSVANKQY